MMKISLLFLLIAFSLTDCTGKPLVGISKFVSNPANDAVESGILDEISNTGARVRIDRQNAFGSTAAAQAIAAKFKKDRARVTVGIAAPSAFALVKAFASTPVVYASLSDPVRTGITAHGGPSGANVAGVSDSSSVTDQIRLFLKMKPAMKRIGLFRMTNEAALAERVREACKERGVELLDLTANAEDSAQTLDKHAARVDGFYASAEISGGNLLPALVEAAYRKRLPVFSADPSSAETCPVLAAQGISHYQMGRAAGAIILKILQGIRPGTINPETAGADNRELLVNLDAAASLGIIVPTEIVEAADVIIENRVTNRRRDGSISRP